MKTAEVTTYLDSVFHPEYQEDYDNAGFLFGEGASEYTGALVALDLTEAVVDEALREGCSLIVTHHPFIFRGLRRLTDATADGRMVMRLAREGLSVYAAHTNLDNLACGVNGALAARLGLTHTAVLLPRGDDPAVGAGMIGTLPHPVACRDFLAAAKQLLGLPVLRHGGLCRSLVQRVAICGGAGSFLIGEALRHDADLFLTADLKYHDFQRTEGRMVLADIGHYESEQFAKDVIYSTISEKFSNFACRISTAQAGLVEYI